MPGFYMNRCFGTSFCFFCICLNIAANLQSVAWFFRDFFLLKTDTCIGLGPYTMEACALIEEGVLLFFLSDLLFISGATSCFEFWFALNTYSPFIGLSISNLTTTSLLW